MVMVVILLGFDITHAVLTLTRYHPMRAVALLATVNGSLDPRVSLAYTSLEQVAKAMRVEIARVEVEVTEIEGAVQRIRDVISELAMTSPVIVDVGGGMRILVLETLLAYMSLPDSLKESVRVVVYLEGTNKALELTTSDVRNLMGGPSPLSAVERAVLKVMALGREYRLGEVHAALREQGVSVTKQYVLKALRRLAAKGLVSRKARGRYVKVRDVGT